MQQDELDNYKKKLAQAQKLEITLDFYKQKYEDCGKLSDTVTELEAKQEHQHSKINDQEKENDGLKTKVKKYMDQYNQMVPGCS